jgi:hypothetical protein
MKKLIIKDKKLRLNLKIQGKQYFVLKTIHQNSNLFNLVRWNAYSCLKLLCVTNSIVSISFRCVYTINRKRFNNIAPFSRHVLLKLIRKGRLPGIKKFSG